MLESVAHLFTTGLIALHAWSDALVAVGLFLVTLALIQIVSRRRDLAHAPLVPLFIVFTLTCGVSHVLAVYTLWHPDHWLIGVLKVLSAVASVATAAYLLCVTPRILGLPTRAELNCLNGRLQGEADVRRRADDKIRGLNEQLQLQVVHLEQARESAEKRAVEEHAARAEGERDFQFLLDLIPALVAYTDPQCRYRVVNRTFQNWFQQSASQIQGRTMLDVLGPEYFGQVENSMKRALRGETVQFQRLLDYPDSPRTVVVTYTPHIDERNETQGVAIFAHDLSGQIEGENQLRRHSALLDQAMEPLLIWELHGSIRYWNRAATELYGFTAEEAIGRVSHELLKTVHGMPLQTFESSLEMEGSWSGELIHTAKDGHEMTVDSRHLLVEEDGRLLVLESNRDITARKKLELTLERRVQERTEQLLEANRELEAFSYSVSHDLRAPLRSVDGFGRILLRDYRGRELDERGIHLIERMGAATVRMGHLIEALLQLSQVSRAPLRIGPVDLSAMAREIWSGLVAEDSDRNASIQIDCDMKVQGDERLLRIVLQNLIGNAFKFAGKVSSPIVRFGCERTSAGTTYFVQDNGAGFDMAHAEQLFVPFQRLHANGDFEGSGIGLAIVQRIIRRHGGNIRGESSVGQGARFSFTLGERKLLEPEDDIARGR